MTQVAPVFMQLHEPHICQRWHHEAQHRDGGRTKQVKYRTEVGYGQTRARDHRHNRHPQQVCFRVYF